MKKIFTKENLYHSLPLLISLGVYWIGAIYSEYTKTQDGFAFRYIEHLGLGMMVGILLFRDMIVKHSKEITKLKQANKQLQFQLRDKNLD